MHCSVSMRAIPFKQARNDTLDFRTPKYCCSLYSVRIFAAMAVNASRIERRYAPEAIIK
jgi:hypothetical protein